MKFKILTYGCAMNKADSECIAGIINEKFNAEIEEYFVDRSQDIDLVGTKIKRVYGPKDIYPFKILPHSCILPYQRR